MDFTKTQAAILKIFTSRIGESFTIREISKKLEQNYSIVYFSIQNLHKNEFLLKDKHKTFSLNYNNYLDLAYIERLRAKEFLKKHKKIALFVKRVIKEINTGFFTFLLFGSYAEGKQTKNSDIDILIIIENMGDVDKIERQLHGISDIYGDFHAHVISKESVKEMISKRGQLNVINETLNKHIIFFGAENYYHLISKWS